MTNLDSMLKIRDITFPTKVHLVKAIVLPVVMYGCESWTIKKAEHRRIDAFELWCWRRLLRVPWIARRPNQSILKVSVLNVHWKDWCWSWNSILWPSDAKNWLIWKDPDAGKDWGPIKIVSHCFHCFPIYLPWSDGTRCHNLSFLNVKL